jgi:transposase InsO family protein
VVNLGIWHRSEASIWIVVVARRRATGTPLSTGAAPNDLWCADFKGEFKLGNGRYCFPLTVTDHASRYLLLCEALESTRENLAITAFEQLFQERGLPQAIRSDNGVPFASPNGLYRVQEPGSNRVFVRHQPNRASGGQSSLMDVRDFLSEGHGPQHEALLHLLGNVDVPSNA